MLNNLPHWAVILSSIAVLHVLSGPHTPRLDEDDLHLEGREPMMEEEVETSTEDMGTAPPIETGEAIGPTLGDILSKFSLGKLPKMQWENNLSFSSSFNYSDYQLNIRAPATAFILHKDTILTSRLLWLLKSNQVFLEGNFSGFDYLRSWYWLQAGENT